MFMYNNNYNNNYYNLCFFNSVIICPGLGYSTGSENNDITVDLNVPDSPDPMISSQWMFGDQTHVLRPVILLLH